VGRALLCGVNVLSFCGIQRDKTRTSVFSPNTIIILSPIKKIVFMFQHIVCAANLPGFSHRWWFALKPARVHQNQLSRPSHRLQHVFPWVL